MYNKFLFALGWFPAFLSASSTVDCSFATAASAGDTCQTFADNWGTDLATFELLNPGVSCPTLVAGQDYCVVGTVKTAQPLTTTSRPVATTSKLTVTTPKPIVTTSKPTKGASTTVKPISTSSNPYSPTQSGLIATCDKFHLVQAGDQCGTIQTKYSISAAQFSAWNPSIDASMHHPFYKTVQEITRSARMR